MPRKKNKPESVSQEIDTTASTAISIEPVNVTATDSYKAQMIDEQPKNWGPPYKAIYTNAAKGFELGENRRFKQRVFTFNDKPDAEVNESLKTAGFKYRAEEKAWTVPATAVTRELSDDLAKQFAGAEQVESRSR